MRSDSSALIFDDLLLEDSNGCLNWTGYAIKSNGLESHRYGRLRINGKKTLAHRFAYMRKHGDIPDGLCVLHSCDNTLCCNVEHLFLGTHADNMADMMRKGRGNRSGCRNPATGEDHRCAKLTIRQVSEAKVLHFFTGVSQSQIARSYNVHSSVLHRAIHGKTWRHIHNQQEEL